MLDAKKADFAQEVDNLRETARKRAIIVGIELMQEGQPATVRARMVEFFAGESKKAVSPVTVNVGQSPGYTYIRPGERVIDVTPDTLSGGPDDKC